jgi:hypothetical protein
MINLVKVYIKLDKQMYKVLEQIEKHLQSLVTYFDNIEIEIDEEERENQTPPKQVKRHIPP